MKETLETSKGRFIITDDLEKINRWINNGRYEYICQVRRCNEKEASEIIGASELILDFNNGKPKYLKRLESLYCILKSQGIEITNNTYIFKV